MHIRDSMQRTAGLSHLALVLHASDSPQLTPVEGFRALALVEAGVAELAVEDRVGGLLKTESLVKDGHLRLGGFGYQLP